MAIIDDFKAIKDACNAISKNILGEGKPNEDSIAEQAPKGWNVNAEEIKECIGRAGSANAGSGSAGSANAGQNGLTPGVSCRYCGNACRRKALGWYCDNCSKYF